MPEKKPQLVNWEVAIIRAMLSSGRFKKQEIVAYFSRPDRSINQARISEIEDGHERYSGIQPASKAELEKFLLDWKQIRFPSARPVPLSPTDPAVLCALFPVRPGTPSRLAISETSTVEGKESFDWGNKHDYGKTLVGMANNRGGYILFGVKDGSFEIVGIQPDRMEKFDLKKANEHFSRTFNQSLELGKGQFEVGGRTVGVLHVQASAAKPVVCTTDGKNLFSGDIFYRYPGETRRIQAPELAALLAERDASAENRLLNLVSKVAENGANNAAIINLSTGEVSGERGQFLIEENLLDKIKFVTEGRLDEADGAPALKVVGDVQPIGTPQVKIQQSVVGSISERQIQDAFLTQTCEYDPKIYIEAQTHLQPLWLPIFYFALKAKLDLKGTKTLLEASESPYVSRIAKHVDRVMSGRPPAGTPSMATIRSEYKSILSNEPIEVSDEHSARRYLHAVRIITPKEVAAKRVFSVLKGLHKRFGNNRLLYPDFRYALATVDLKYFRDQILS